MKRVIVYVESDDHGGNVRGLLNPETELTEDYLSVSGDGMEVGLRSHTPGLRAWQKYLWAIRKKNLKRLRKLARKDDIVYLHTGDMTQGKKYAQDWVSAREGDQFEIAYWNHKPVMELKNLVAVRYVEGTSSHVFGDGTSEEILTKRMRAEYPKLDIKASQHGVIDVGGFTIDYAHHGPGPGNRKWLEGNIASYYLRDQMLRELLHGRVPPKMYLRAHYHTWVKAMWNVSVGQKDHTSFLCLLPPMCGIGAYGRQVTKSVSAVINGAIALEVIDGELFKIHRWTKTIDLKRREIIK